MIVRRTIRPTATLVAAFGVFALLKLTARDRPVLFEYRESGDPARNSLHLILNPGVAIDKIKFLD